MRGLRCIGAGLHRRSQRRRKLELPSICPARIGLSTWHGDSDAPTPNGPGPSPARRSVLSSSAGAAFLFRAPPVRPGACWPTPSECQAAHVAPAVHGNEPYRAPDRLILPIPSATRAAVAAHAVTSDAQVSSDNLAGKLPSQQFGQPVVATSLTSHTHKTCSGLPRLA